MEIARWDDNLCDKLHSRKWVWVIQESRNRKVKVAALQETHNSLLDLKFLLSTQIPNVKLTAMSSTPDARIRSNSSPNDLCKAKSGEAVSFYCLCKMYSQLIASDSHLSVMHQINRHCDSKLWIKLIVTHTKMRMIYGKLGYTFACKVDLNEEKETESTQNTGTTNRFSVRTEDENASDVKMDVFFFVDFCGAWQLYAVYWSTALLDNNNSSAHIFHALHQTKRFNGATRGVCTRYTCGVMRFHLVFPPCIPIPYVFLKNCHLRHSVFSKIKNRNRS